MLLAAANALPTSDVLELEQGMCNGYIRGLESLGWTCSADAGLASTFTCSNTDARLSGTSEDSSSSDWQHTCEFSDGTAIGLSTLPSEQHLTLQKRLHEAEGHGDHAEHDHDTHGTEEEKEGEGMDITTFKWLMLFAMLFCIGFGVIPKVWTKCRDSETTLSLLNCFAAGMFLGMSLIHMLPEAQEMYSAWAASEGIDRAFPLPYVMYFVGYLMILAVDRVAARKWHVHQYHGLDPRLNDGSTWDKE